MNTYAFLFGRPLGLPTYVNEKRYFDPTPIIVSAAATQNAIMSGISGMTGSSVQDSTESRAYNQYMTAWAREQQLIDQLRAEQNHSKDLDWADQQRLKQNAFLASENSPSAQVHKLLAAGINPAAAFGQTGSAGQVGSAPSAPSVPSLPSMVGSPAVPNTSGLTFARSQAIQAYGDVLAKFIGVGLDASKLMPEIENLVSSSRKNVADANKTESDAVGVALDNVFKSKSMPDRLKQEYEKARELQNKGDLIGAQKVYQSLQNSLSELDLDIKGTTKQDVIDGIRKQNDLLDERIKTEKTQQVSNRASAANQFAQAKTEDDMRKWRVLSAKSIAEIDDLRRRIETNPEQYFDQAVKYQQGLLTDLDNAVTRMDFNEKERKELGILVSRLRDQTVIRDKSKLIRALDDMLSWLTSHIGVSMTGSVSHVE